MRENKNQYYLKVMVKIYALVSRKVINNVLLPVLSNMLNTLSQKYSQSYYSKALMHVCTLILYKHEQVSILPCALVERAGHRVHFENGEVVEVKDPVVNNNR